MNALLIAALIAVGPAFSYVVIDPTPPSGSGCCLDICAVGDLNGDGLDDVAVGSENSIGLVWYQAPTWARHTIGAGSFTTDGEIVDVDGDGDLDVLISCISRYQLEWWENAGGAWIVHRIGSGIAHDLAVGDIDGDGDIDVVAFRKNLDVAWFEAPTWTRHLIASSSGEGLDLGDLDGDGDLDILAGRAWLENPSWTSHTVASSWSSNCRDIAADMDGDGDLDVVLTHSEGSGRVSWFENPSWTEHRIGVDILTGAHSLEVADFDLDGDLDVFTGEMHTSPQDRVLVYENTDGGITWSRLTLATTGTHNARVGDVNGDHKPDLVGKNYDGPKQVEAWINDTPSAARPTPPAPFRIVSVTPGLVTFELDQDAKVSIAAYSVTGARLSTVVNATLEAGRHTAAWSAPRSGVYFIRLTSGTFSTSTKGVSVR